MDEQLTLWYIDYDGNLQPQHKSHGEWGHEQSRWDYGRTHDMDCPGCQDTPFTLSPRSETYWAT